MTKDPHYVSGEECVIVKIEDKIYLYSIEALYSLILQDEKTIGNVFAKVPNDVYILDRDTTWVKINLITKMKRDRLLVYSKVEGTDTLITSENYRLIISNDPEDTKEVRYIGNSRRILRDGQIGTRDFAGMLDHIKIDFMDHYIEDGYCINRYKGFYHTCHRYFDIEGNKVSLLGYFTGKFIMDGNYIYDLWGEEIGVKVPCPNDFSEELARGIYRDTGICLEIISGNDGNDILFTENVALLTLFKKLFQLKENSIERTLPPEILMYPKEFQMGIIDAFLDADPRHPHAVEPTYKKHGRKLSAQFAVVARVMDIEGRMAFREGNHPAEYPRCGYILNWNRRPFSNSVKSEWRVITKATTLSNRTILERNEYVYNISTESHSLLINNIWVHD